MSAETAPEDDPVQLLADVLGLPDDWEDTTGVSMRMALDAIAKVGWVVVRAPGLNTGDELERMCGVDPEAPYDDICERAQSCPCPSVWRRRTP